MFNNNIACQPIKYTYKPQLNCDHTKTLICHRESLKLMHKIQYCPHIGCNVFQKHLKKTSKSLGYTVGLSLCNSKYLVSKYLGC